MELVNKLFMYGFTLNQFFHFFSTWTIWLTQFAYDFTQRIGFYFTDYKCYEHCCNTIENSNNRNRKEPREIYCGRDKS